MSISPSHNSTTTHQLVRGSSAFDFSNPLIVNKVIAAVQSLDCTAETALKTFQEHGITTENERYQIAMTEAISHPYRASTYIKKYNLSEQYRLEVAKIAAPRIGMDFLQPLFINKYELSEGSLSKIKEVIFEEYLSKIGYTPGKIDFENEDHRFQLALQIADKDFENFVEMIPFLDLTEDHRFKIVLKVAKHNIYLLISDNIDKFELPESYRFEIAKVLAEQNGDKVLSYIDSFLLNGEHRFEIAKILATQNEGQSSEPNRFISACNLNEAHRFELAKIAAGNNGKLTSRNIGNYNLGESDRFEIAKIAAEQIDVNILKHLENNYRLSEDHLFKVLEVALKRYFRKVSLPIENCDFSCEVQRYHVLKMFAEYNAKKASHYIHLFKLEKNHRFEIAKTAASKNGVGTSKYILNYNLNDNENFFIAATAVGNGAKFQHIQQYYPIFRTYRGILRSSASDFTHAIGGYPEHLQGIIEKVSNMQDEHLRQKLIYWVIPILYCYENCQAFRNEYGRIEGLLVSLENYRDPHRRQLFTFELLSTFYADEVSNFRSGSVAHVGNDEQSACLDCFSTSIPSYKQIPFLLVAKACRYTEKSELEAMVSRLCCNKDKRFLRSLNNGLHALANCRKMSAKDKRAILNIVANSGGNSGLRSKNIKKTMLLLESLIRLDHAESLVLLHLDMHRSDQSVSTAASSSTGATQPETSVLNQLEEIYKRRITESFNLDTDENYLKQFLKTFYRFRDPFATFKYLGSINQLPEMDRKITKESFEVYIHSVLKGTYRKERYDTNKNIHLRKVFQENEGLRKKWIKGEKVAESELNIVIAASSRDRETGQQTKQRVKTDNLLIIDTDHPEELLLCGTDVMSSCQHINGDPEANKALVGFLLNGQTRMVAVKNADGNLLARCMLRLLINQKTGKPALYREYVYYGYVANKQHLSTLLHAMCSRRAEAMKLPLYSAKQSHPPLTSLGGPAPFEYVDGLRQIVFNGEYTIIPVK